jgi:hypothetical protein
MAADSAACVVRVLAGVLSLGDTFDTAVSVDGMNYPIDLRIVGMWRYPGMPVDMIEPPHAARLELAGSGTQALADAAFLTGTHTETHLPEGLS